MTSKANDLTISRILRAPRSAVWRAWVNPEHLERWWAPAPVKTSVQEMDLRPGGSFRTVMRMEDGTEHAGPGCFLEVIPHERIVFTDALEGGWRPAQEPFFTAIITMEDHPEGTLYTARALHKNSEDRQRHQEMGFEQGWGTCIGQLEKVAAAL